jgi:pimeloyl-ACP methyl ester carboxylesterase
VLGREKVGRGSNLGPNTQLCYCPLSVSGTQHGKTESQSYRYQNIKGRRSIHEADHLAATSVFQLLSPLLPRVAFTSIVFKRDSNAQMGPSILSIALLAVCATARPSIYKRQNETSMVYDFKDITPSPQLAWQPCFGEFTCTYLTVPLDYDDPDVGTTDVAYIKYTSANGTGQDILFNPGGPGSSGVVSLINFKDEFVKLFGNDYNFISFDPRGVNNSGPALSCGKTGPGKSSAPLPEKWALAKANGEFCAAFNKNTSASYAGTSAVVQDMVHLTELEAEACGKNPEEAKLWYYGISYGTVIGQTLAAMYPDRLGRLLLDGNVYGVEHYQGFVPSAVEETDVAFGFFFDYCYEAGPELCPLAENATSAFSVQNRYQAFLRKVELEPITVKGDASIITRNDIELVAFKAMYSPNNGFYALARQIVAMEQGDTSEVPALLSILGIGSAFETAFPSDPDGQENTGGAELQLITCVDTAGRYALKSFSDYRAASEQLAQKSTYGGSTIASANVLFCNGLDIAPPASQLFPGFQETNTSVPILFVGTTGDPVTPVYSAHKMSEIFPGSVVLTQKAPGHSFLALESKCSNAYAAAYMKDGSLPDVGAVCGIDVTAADVFSAGAKVFENTLAQSAT